MKKFLLLLLSLGPALAFGAYQYGADLHDDGYAVKAYSDDKGNQTNVGVGWYMTVLTDCSLSFKTTMETQALINRYADAKPGLASDMGYFLFDDAQIISQHPLTFDNNGIFTIDRLNTGEKLGFWIADADGKINYSMKFEQGSWVNVLNGRGNYGSNNSNRVFEFSLGGQVVTPVIFGVGAPAPAPSGQPLPGVLASLLLGRAFCGGLIRRARRS